MNNLYKDEKNEPFIFFVFIYENPKPPKKLGKLETDIINFINNSKIDGISQISISEEDYDTKNWLINNEKGVRIDKYPVFLISETNKPTIVKNATIEEAKKIIETLKKLIGY